MSVPPPKRNPCITSVVFLVSLCLSFVKAARSEFVLNNTSAPPYTNAQGDGFLDVIVTEAFVRAGAKVRFVQLPPERGLRNANEGIEDGDFTRIAGIETHYPNLIRVDEKVIDWNFSAFARRADFSPQPGWTGLHPYSIGFIRGWKIAEKNLSHALDSVAAVDPQQLFRLLEWGRTDVVVYSREMGVSYIQTQGLRGIFLIEPPLETSAMFIYLHKKHAAFAPKLAEAIRTLKADGTYARVYTQTVALNLNITP